MKPSKGKHSLKKGNLLFKINDKFLLKPIVHFYNTLLIYTSITLFCCFYTNSPQSGRLKTITQNTHPLG
ncbi:hypothetical protein HMPREF0604_01583 [Neisseria mucosa C102]|uniref:Uncharacterized protein n=1 Tax=Neisseria mucosa C102 TaxID=435832 RepID=A0ABN0C9X3_NEIMU|nr:hypothetical protein HMPREF0604_01583 [Neisseria mucosa C102]